MSALACHLLLTVGCNDIRPAAKAPNASLSNSADGVRIVYQDGHLPSLPMTNGREIKIRSLLNVRKTMHFGDWIWNEAGVEAGTLWVRVDLSRQTLSVFRAGHEVGTAVILYGTDGKPTPLGTFPVLERAAVHRSTLYDAPMPYMLRITGDGVAIHASEVRQGRATHGCIGVPLAFAQRLFEQAKRGTLVTIVST